MEETRIDPAIAYDVIELPSKGIHYTNKKKSVRVAYLTASDENILSSPSFLNTNTVITELLKRKILDKDLNIEEIVEEDRQAILIFLRNTAFGPELNLNLTDPSTKKPFQTAVLLDQLSIINGQQPNDDGTFTVFLPKSQSTIKIRPLNYGEIMEIARLSETYPQGRTVPKVTWRMQKEIVEVDGSADKAVIGKFIESLPKPFRVS